MVYALWTDMVERYGERELIQLTDRDDTGEIVTVVLDRSINDATAFVDGFVGRVYRLPLQGCAKPTSSGFEYVAPPVLTRIVCDLARYYLYTNLPDEHEAARRYVAATKDLRDISEGRQQLICPWGGEPGEALNASVLESQDVYHSFSRRQITDDSMRGFA